MKPASILSALAILASAAPAQSATENALGRSRTLYQLPSQTQLYTAFENQAFRRDGSVLLTSYTNGTVWSLVPPFSESSLSAVTSFEFDPDVTATLGIVESTPDVFYVATSHFNSSFANFTSTPGSNKIYRLCFPGPKIELAAQVKGAEFLNGLAMLNDTYLLAADSQRGSVWGIDTTTGASTELVVDKALGSYPALRGPFGNGINGLKFHKNWIYFTNTIRASFGRIRIEPHTLKTAPVETVANFSLPGRPVVNNVQPDDLLVLENGDALVSLRSEAKVARVNPSGRLTKIYDLGETFNATSLSFKPAARRNLKEATLYATGVFGKYFDFPLFL